MKKQVYFSETDYCNQVNMGIFETNAQGEPVKVARLIFENYEQFMPAEPTVAFTKKEAQAIMDRLWQIGLRPSNGEGNAGQLGATERHLEDMRKIALNRLGLDKKEVNGER